MTLSKVWGCRVRLWAVLLVIAMMGSRHGALVALGEDPSGKEAQAKTTSKPPKKTVGSDGIAQATLAIQLATEGERRRSPILLLAAAEILGGLKESDRPARDLKVERQDGGGADTKEGQEKGERPADTKASQEQGGGRTDKASVRLTLPDLAEKAREFAKGDKDLSALVESRLEQLSSRGLILSQGQRHASVSLGNVTYKHMCDEEDARGNYYTIGAGGKHTITGLTFEADRPAVVGVIGDGDGDLDLWVYDGPTNNLIGQDTDDTSACRVNWYPSSQRSVTVVIRNVGRVAERFHLLANW